MIADLEGIRVAGVGLLVAVFIIGPAWLSATMARRKGYRPLVFAVFGLILGLLMPLIIVFMPSKLGGQTETGRQRTGYKR